MELPMPDEVWSRSIHCPESSPNLPPALLPDYLRRAGLQWQRRNAPESHSHHQKALAKLPQQVPAQVAESAPVLQSAQEPRQPWPLPRPASVLLQSAGLARQASPAWQTFPVQSFWYFCALGLPQTVKQNPVWALNRLMLNESAAALMILMARL